MIADLAFVKTVVVTAIVVSAAPKVARETRNGEAVDRTAMGPLQAEIQGTPARMGVIVSRDRRGNPSTILLRHWRINCVKTKADPRPQGMRVISSTS